MRQPMLGERINWAHPSAYRLISWWIFNEGHGGILHDLTDNGNHGTLMNMDPATDWVLGNNEKSLGYALDFDPVNDYVDIGKKALGQTGPFSIAAWIKPAVVNINQEIISEMGGSNLAGEFIFRIRSTGVLRFLRRTGTSNNIFRQDSNSSITANVWTHVACVFSGASDSDMEIYINAVADGATPLSGSNSTSNDGFTQIGASDGGINFSGMMENIHMYNRSLIPQEIIDSFDHPFAGIKRPPFHAFATVVDGTNPKGPLGHPLHGPLGGPIYV